MSHGFPPPGSEDGNADKLADVSNVATMAGVNAARMPACNAATEILSACVFPAMATGIMIFVAYVVGVAPVIGVSTMC